MLINYWLEGDTSSWFRALNDQDVESKTKWGAATKRQRASCSTGRGCRSGSEAPREMLCRPPPTLDTPSPHPPSLNPPAPPPSPYGSPTSETLAAPAQRRGRHAKHGDVFKCKIVWRQATGRESDGTHNAFVAGCNAPQTNSAIFIAWRSRKSFWIHAHSPGGSRPRWLMHRRDTGHCCVAVWRSAK